MIISISFQKYSERLRVFKTAVILCDGIYLFKFKNWPVIVFNASFFDF